MLCVSVCVCVRLPVRLRRSLRGVSGSWTLPAVPGALRRPAGSLRTALWPELLPGRHLPTLQT